jgi:hypothetical protein
VSDKFVWQNTGSFLASQDKFCDVPSVITFSKLMEGRKRHNLTETKYGPKIFSEFTSDKPLVLYSQTLKKIILKIIKNNKKSHNIHSERNSNK